MTFVQAGLIFAGIPVAVFALVAAAIYGAGARRAKRYRLGRKFDFTPVWFTSASRGSGTPALAGTGQYAADRAMEKGGARGSW